MNVQEKQTAQDIQLLPRKGRLRWVMMGLRVAFTFAYVISALAMLFFYENYGAGSGFAAASAMILIDIAVIARGRTFLAPFSAQRILIIFIIVPLALIAVAAYFASLAVHESLGPHSQWLAFIAWLVAAKWAIVAARDAAKAKRLALPAASPDPIHDTVNGVVTSAADEEKQPLL